MAPPPSDSDRMAGAAMKGLQFTAEWAPRSDYTLSEFERRTGKAVTGSSVWRNPRVRLADVKEPPLPAKDVRIRPRACGVCMRVTAAMPHLIPCGTGDKNALFVIGRKVCLALAQSAGGRNVLARKLRITG